MEIRPTSSIPAIKKSSVRKKDKTAFTLNATEATPAVMASALVTFDPSFDSGEQQALNWGNSMLDTLESLQDALIHDTFSFGPTLHDIENQLALIPREGVPETLQHILTDIENRVTIELAKIKQFT